MESKKLNEQELEQVTGGQAVLPLLSSEEGEDTSVVAGFAVKTKCPYCSEMHTVPDIQIGREMTCSACGQSFIAKRS